MCQKLIFTLCLYGSAVELEKAWLDMLTGNDSFLFMFNMIGLEIHVVLLPKRLYFKRDHYIGKIYWTGDVTPPDPEQILKRFGRS